MIKPTRKKDITANWHLLDAKDQVLGRLATRIIPLLTGKKKPYYTPNLDCGDHVVIINAAAVKLTGSKEQDKKYYHYSGYPGGLKATPLSKVREKKPELIIESAVKNMLPKNKLRDVWLKKLHVFGADSHPYAGQLNPVAKAKPAAAVTTKTPKTTKIPKRK